MTSLTLRSRRIAKHQAREDGVNDVLALSTVADTNGIADTGALFQWNGGSQLTSTPTLTVWSDSTASTTDLLGAGTTQGLWLADLTGDLQPDLISGSPWADADGIVDAGAMYFATNQGLPGLFRQLFVLNAEIADRLGS